MQSLFLAAAATVNAATEEGSNTLTYVAAGVRTQRDTRAARRGDDEE
jgi:hypothetical protein